MALLMVYAYSHITTLLSESIIFDTNEYSKATGTGRLESDALLAASDKSAFNLLTFHRQINIVRVQIMYGIKLFNYLQSFT
jgi:hypothetical protein